MSTGKYLRIHGAAVIFTAILVIKICLFQLCHTVPMEVLAETEKMRIFIRGSDHGNAVLTALALIIILSTLTVSFIPRITAVKSYSHEYKTWVINTNEQKNKEIIERYDLY